MLARRWSTLLVRSETVDLRFRDHGRTRLPFLLEFRAWRHCSCCTPIDHRETAVHDRNRVTEEEMETPEAKFQSGH